MHKEIFFYGAGGHCKVLIENALSNNFTINAVFDDDVSNNGKSLFGFPIVANYNPDLFPSSYVFVSIGNNKIRKRIYENIQHPKINLIHPTANVSKFADIGLGTSIFVNAVINPAVQIGENCIINTGAIIEHDCKIGSHVHIAPSVTMCGQVDVGEGSFLGVGVKVVPLVKIGKWCQIDAGVVLTRTVPDFTRVKRNGEFVKFS